MSTELINRHREGYQLTGFYGGDTRGYCLQITGDHGYVQLTREAAACLAADIFRYFLETPTPAGDAQPVAWVAADTLHSPHPTCVSSLAYMSQLDQDRGREYVPLYAAPVAASVKPLARQTISDRFSFLEGVVNEHNYRRIVDTACEIARAAPVAAQAPAASADQVQALREALHAAAEYIGDRSADSSTFWDLYDAAMAKGGEA